MRTKEFIEKTVSVLPLLFGVMNLKEELTIEALKHNEKIIEKTYPFGHKPLATTLIPFAVHLGETIIKLIPGAKWLDMEVKNPFDLELLTPMNNKILDENTCMHTYPMNRVHKFWNESREFNMSCIANTLIFISQNDMNDPKFQTMIDEDGWFQIGGGDMIRIIKQKINNDLPN